MKTIITITIEHDNPVSDLPATLAANNATKAAVESTRWRETNVTTDVEMR